MELQKGGGPYPHCWRCNIELNPFIVDVHLRKHCPRCGYDLTIIDVGQGIVDPEELKRRVGLNEFCDLLQILHNWAVAYKRQVEQNGVDWSLPHEYLQEVAEQMLPYIARLRQTEYIDQEHLTALSENFWSYAREIVQELEQEESLMRLTGRWTDDEQEIKDYWQEQFSKANGLTFQQFLSLPMRNEQRESCDKR